MAFAVKTQPLFNSQLCGKEERSCAWLDFVSGRPELGGIWFFLQNLTFTSRRIHDKILDEFFDEIQAELTLIVAGSCCNSAVQISTAGSMGK